MERLVAGLPALALITAVTTSKPAAAEAEPGLDVDPVDQIAQLTDGQVPTEAVERFLSADREAQAELLAAAGFVDPGGDIDLESWRLSVLGQWLVRQGDTVRGLELQIRSGTLPPIEALRLAQAIGPALPLLDAELSDTMLATGLSYNDAVDRARLQRLAYLMRPALSEVDAGYLSLSVSDDARTLVYRTTRPDQARIRLAPTAPVTVEGASYSLRELEAERNRIAAPLQASLGGAYVSIDKTAEQILIEIPAELIGHESLAAGTLAEAVSSGRVRIEPLVGTTGDEVAYRGGEEATGCTWGFSLANPNVPGWGGLSTSGHCGDTQSYVGRSLTYLISQWFGEADYQVHSVPPNEIIVNDIWIGTSPNFYRDITATAGWSSIDVNDVVCLSGAVTSYNCGFVTNVTSQQAAQSSAGGSASHAVLTTLTSAPGDSGSPIFFGQTALGNHDGKVSDAETFISLTYNQAGLSVQVRTK